MERLDSALYSLPYDTTQLRRVLKTRNNLQSDRFSGFFQDTWTWRKEGLREFQIIAGVRGQYWTLTAKVLVTPRAQFLYKPLNTKRDLSYRLAGGLYYQPAFYREMRRLDGTVNTKRLRKIGAHRRRFYLRFPVGPPSSGENAPHHRNIL